MGRRLLVDNEGIGFFFPRQKRLAAFGAVELIVDRLELDAQVVRHRDEDSMQWVWAIAINAPRRDVYPEEMEQALEISRLVMAAEK